MVQSKSFGLRVPSLKRTSHITMRFHHRLWYHVLSLHYACIRSSGIILIPYATFVPNFVSFAASIVELAHGEKSHTQSLTQLIWCPGNRSFCFGTRSRKQEKSAAICCMISHKQNQCWLETGIQYTTKWPKWQITCTVNLISLNFTEP